MKLSDPRFKRSMFLAIWLTIVLLPYKSTVVKWLGFEIETGPSMPCNLAPTGRQTEERGSQRLGGLKERWARSEEIVGPERPNTERGESTLSCSLLLHHLLPQIASSSPMASSPASSALITQSSTLLSPSLYVTLSFSFTPQNPNPKKRIMEVIHICLFTYKFIIRTEMCY